MINPVLTTTTRPMRVCGYVERSLAALIDDLASDGIAETLGLALADAIAVEVDDVSVQTSQPIVFSAITAEVTASWHVTFRAGRDREGTASVGLVVVQSGSQPVTEVLVTMEIDDREATAVADATHRFLDMLTERLA